MNGTRPGGLLGVFAHLDTTMGAFHQLEAASFRSLRVLSPVPRHEILDALYPRPSPVRIYSLVGAIAGTFGGIALATFTGRSMHRMAFLVGGKPVDAWPAYFVIGFELTVLFGALATMAGFLIHSRLPRWKTSEPYDPVFSDDRFGLFVPCEARRRSEVKRLLEQAGAEEVRVVEA